MRARVITKLCAPGGGPPLQVVALTERRGEHLIHGSVFAHRRGLYPIRNGILDLLPRGTGTLTLAQRSNLLAATARWYERPWRVNSLALLSRREVGLQEERQRFEDWLTPAPGLWLDLASSTGLYSRWLVPHLNGMDADIVGLDFAEPMLREAQRRAQQDGAHDISWVRARAESLPCPDGSLSGLVCGGSLNEFGPATPAILREVARVLQPEGQAFFMFLLEAEGPGRIAARVVERGGIQFWAAPAAEALFAEAGLQIDRFEEYGPVAFALLHRAPSIDLPPT